MHTIRNKNRKILGLGCSTFGGSKSKKTALRALDAAFHNGIYYFDIARSYGYGQAESILGEFIKGKRDQVIIASKFGIAPPKPFPFMEQVKNAVRFAKKIAPGISGKLIGAYSQNNVERPTITPRLVIESLEKSLSELRTDYLDEYLIHESPFADASADDICFALEKAKEKGMIRNWGATCENEQEVRKYFQKDSPFQTVQFPYHPNSPFMGSQNDNRNKVVFSVMRQSEGFSNIPTSFYMQMKANEVSSGLIKNLQEAWLYIASNEMSSGVLLCSMTKESHIKRNIAIFEAEPLGFNELSNMKHALLNSIQPYDVQQTMSTLQPSAL